MEQSQPLHINVGPLEPLLEDPDVREIMVNAPDAVFVEKHGQLIKTDVQFEDEYAILAVIRSIAGAVGRVIDEAHPIVDVRLPDHSRMHAVVRPIAVNGPVFNIAKTINNRPTFNDLVAWGALDDKTVRFLTACVQGNLNVMVSGGSGSGKTTILENLIGIINPDERLVLCEQVTEVMSEHPHLLSFETRPSNIDGQGEVTLSALIRSAMKMRPERILSSNMTGDGVWEMLQAMSTGYNGSMFDIHASNITDALEHLEIMCVSSTNLPLLQIRGRIAQALDLIVHQDRLHDGIRRITAIAEVVGLQNGVIVTQDVMRFEPTGEQDNRIIGVSRFTGRRPAFVDRLDLPSDFFVTA